MSYCQDWVGKCRAGRIWAKRYIFNQQQNMAEAEVTQNAHPSPRLVRYLQRLANPLYSSNFISLGHNNDYNECNPNKCKQANGWILFQHHTIHPGFY